MMRYLIDKLAVKDTEWLIVGRLDSPVCEVWENSAVIEFSSDRQAYNYALDRYKQAADLRQFQPGQEIELPMADGTLKTFRVMTNNPQNITLQDNTTGEEAAIPHFQPGGQPNIVKKPESHPANEYSMQAPDEYATALSVSDFKKQARGWGIVGVNTLSSFTTPEVLWSDGNITRESLDKLPVGARELITDMRQGKAPNRWTEIDDQKNWYKTAEPQMPNQQAMPNQDVIAPEKSERDFAEPIHSPPAPKQETTNDKRPLSRHEIVEEAETLIRNALYKGIKVGAWDLVNYMQQYYSNDPDELYEGADFAWKKVQYEEPEMFGEAEGPGPSQPRPNNLERQKPQVPGAEPNARPSTPSTTEPAGPMQVKL